jgi:hypothetical protein
MEQKNTFINFTFLAFMERAADYLLTCYMVGILGATELNYISAWCLSSIYGVFGWIGISILLVLLSGYIASKSMKLGYFLVICFAIPVIWNVMQLILVI